MQCGQRLNNSNPAVAASLFERVTKSTTTTAQKTLARQFLFAAWDDAKKNAYITQALASKNGDDLAFANAAAASGRRASGAPPSPCSA